MRIDYSKKFLKKLEKSDKIIRKMVFEKVSLYINDKFHPLLNNHTLHGEYEGCRSINITGDYRAIFRENKNRDIILFLLLGTHGELYE
ncbi:MAG: type II toxin-antitoxin system mRNA interferase toxin, RelE/StbE family [bacterium]